MRMEGDLKHQGAPTPPLRTCICRGFAQTAPLMNIATAGMTMEIPITSILIRVQPQPIRLRTATNTTPTPYTYRQEFHRLVPLIEAVTPRTDCK